MNFKKSNAVKFFLSLVLCASGTISAASAEPSGLVIKNGDKIAFLGDSITQAGARKGGYVSLVIEALKGEGLEVSSIAAGVSGNRSPEMLARLERDVIQKKPQWMVLSCGVNDVWHFKLKLGERAFTGVPLEDYKRNITAIIDNAQAADIKILVMTSTMIGEDQSRELNQNLIPYNDFLREIAKEKGCLLADLNADMQTALKEIPDVKGKANMFGDPGYQSEIKNKLTSDGCHMNAPGNVMMAKGVLRSLGMPGDRINAWQGKR
jgi:lysophospholipase L1-like esterase